MRFEANPKAFAATGVGGRVGRRDEPVGARLLCGGRGNNSFVLEDNISLETASAAGRVATSSGFVERIEHLDFSDAVERLRTGGGTSSCGRGGLERGARQPQGNVRG